ncbi:MAG TPA: TldD/PmbA family protein [Acidimicrobiales bacterium]|nr:TldD/PmbA family protein [Acidimicrobiales bacterium]
MLDQLERYADHLDHYTELRLHTNHAKNVQLIGGNVVANSSSSRGGASARRYEDGAFGFASFPSMSDDAIPGALKAAGSNVALLQRRAPMGKGDLPVGTVGRGVFDYRSTKPALTDAEQLDAMRAIDDYLRSTYPDLANIDVSLSFLAMEKGLATSAGALTYSYIPRTIVVARISYMADDGAVEVYDAFGGFGDPQEHLTDVSLMYPELDELYQRVRDKAAGVFAKPGEHDVIMDSRLAGILAHEAIGHTCEADLVLGGSVAGDHVGDVVASEKVTLVDYAERGPDGNGGIAIHVDDEGVECRDVTIIDKGVLKTFLHNKETAREMGAEPTGNARAYAFDDEPLVRMRNTTIAPGADKLEDMIASVDHGYYLTRPTNGQADSTSEFMFGIGMGYEIEGGKITRAIRDTTISGVAFDMLKTVTHVSDDMTWGKGGMCGKKQMIPVGMGGPAVKCRITIGGRS